MISPLRNLPSDDTVWKDLFNGALLDLLPPKVRFAGPRMRENIMWFSGDATLTRVSCVNWNAKEFLCMPVSDLLDSFMPKHQQGLIIELLSMILSSVIWDPQGRKKYRGLFLITPTLYRG